MKTHFVHDRIADTYFRTVDGQAPAPTAKDKSEADLYEQHEACAIASLYFGPDSHEQGKWEILEATPQEYFKWLGRKGGQSNTAKQDRARKRNGARHGGRYRTCRQCGGRIARGAPASVHVCENCQKESENV